MSYCLVEDVKRLVSIKPSHFGFKDKNSAEAEMDDLISDWIKQSESLINSYCGRKFSDKDDEVPIAIRNVCIRLTSNIIAFYQLRKDNPLIEVNDWKTELTSSEVFTNDLKQDLKPFLRAKKAHVFRI